MNVTVANPSGKVAYTGKTSGEGTFATPALPPGEYVVQLSAKADKDGQYSVVVSSGKQKVVAASVDGAKFAGGGVAVKVKVGKGLNIAGQVADATRVAASGKQRVKVMNGKRYFWVSNGGLGSNLGGRWVEEGSADWRSISRMSNEDLQDVRDRANIAAQAGPVGNTR
jgi:hypothetical protein